ncbi:MAG TPA: hypothetical protein DF383_07260 [Deltaproteobacteria bacterium]|nr:hypothetical protein [Deltaproteobacteria bacterium]
MQQSSPLKNVFWIFLAMLICTFAAGLTLGLIQTLFKIQITGGYRVAGIAAGTTIGLLLGNRWVRRKYQSKA